MPVVITRKSLPLTEHDLNDLDRLRESPERLAALGAIIGASEPPISDAQLLHALLEAGLRAVRDQLLEDGYNALADDPDYQDHAAETRKMARRARAATAE